MNGNVSCTVPRLERPTVMSSTTVFIFRFTFSPAITARARGGGAGAGGGRAGGGLRSEEGRGGVQEKPGNNSACRQFGKFM